MTGNFIDTIRLGKSKLPNSKMKVQLIETDYGKLRVLDTKGNKPVIINVPDGPNIIEHHQTLIEKLSVNFRVICFEFPGLGFSFPTIEHDYSFERSAKILLQLMDILQVEKAALCFSCSNGFYAIKAAEIVPERFTYLFLTQTPSVHSMKEWTDLTIPKILTYPIIGQLINSFTEKKLARIWYKTALPKSTDKTEYENIAFNSLHNGGCFCLSSLVQGLTKQLNSSLKQTKVPSTQIWGKKDYSHRKTDSKSIFEHLPNCEIIEFDNCGHFPELESIENYVRLVNERLNNLKAR
jgi:pimeloyl-ACP methyl ester carboxylesterase